MKKFSQMCLQNWVWISDGHRWSHPPTNFCLGRVHNQLGLVTIISSTVWDLSRWQVLPPGNLVTSSLLLLPGAMSESRVLPQSGSILIFTVHTAIKGCRDVQSLGCKLWPWGHPRVMLPTGTFWSEWSVVPPRAMMFFWSGLLQKRHVWDCGITTTSIWGNAQGACCHQGPWGWLESEMLPQTLSVSEDQADPTAMLVNVVSVASSSLGDLNGH